MVKLENHVMCMFPSHTCTI